VAWDIVDSSSVTLRHREALRVWLRHNGLWHSRGVVWSILEVWFRTLGYDLEQ